MSTFTRQLRGKVIIARPSFALYESHCQYDGIPYEIWPLNADLEYDLKLLPEIPEYSVIAFASPNNPVGNVLKKQTLAELASQHPSSLFLADEAYYEFAEEPYLDLLTDHPNILLIRTLSKAVGAAGVRLGYFVGAENIITQLKKLRVPYLLNNYGLAALEQVLLSEDAEERFAATVKNAIAERTRVCQALASFASWAKYTVKESQANFILLRWTQQDEAQRCYNHLIENDILIRNVSGGPGLAGCLRMSIGLPWQNDKFIEAMSRFV